MGRGEVVWVEGLLLVGVLIELANLGEPTLLVEEHELSDGPLIV